MAPGACCRSCERPLLRCGAHCGDRTLGALVAAKGATSLSAPWPPKSISWAYFFQRWTRILSRSLSGFSTMILTDSPTRSFSTILTIPLRLGSGRYSFATLVLFWRHCPHHRVVDEPYLRRSCGSYVGAKGRKLPAASRSNAQKM
jgi:hypothetical protein